MFCSQANASVQTFQEQLQETRRELDIQSAALQRAAQRMEDLTNQNAELGVQVAALEADRQEQEDEVEQLR